MTITEIVEKVESKLTEDLVKQCLECTSTEEVMRLASSNGIELS